MRIIKPPTKIDGVRGMRIFLAGSIEMGKAENWQEGICQTFKHVKDMTIFNPRRDDWDSSWEQSIDNAQFREQVEWELKALEDADLIVMYFDVNTISPITLLELGLFARDHDSMVVCCPEGYHRKGNVDIVCNRYLVDRVDNMDELISYLWREWT